MCVSCNRGRCEECVEGYELFPEHEEGESDPPTCLNEEEHRSEQDVELEALTFIKYLLARELEHLTELLLEEQEHEENEREDTELLCELQ